MAGIRPPCTEVARSQFARSLLLLYPSHIRRAIPHRVAHAFIDGNLLLGVAPSFASLEITAAVVRHRWQSNLLLQWSGWMTRCPTSAGTTPSFPTTRWTGARPCSTLSSAPFSTPTATTMTRAGRAWTRQTRPTSGVQRVVPETPDVPCMVEACCCMLVLSRVAAQ